MSVDIEIHFAEMAGMGNDIEESSRMIKKRLARLKETLEKRRKIVEARKNLLKELDDIDTDPDWYLKDY